MPARLSCAACPRLSIFSEKRTCPMTTLQWDDALLLDLPELDTIHREFVDLMAQAQDAPDEQLLAQWQHIISHTEEHFGLEDRWMRAAGFAPDNCHMHQHHS